MTQCFADSCSAHPNQPFKTDPSISLFSGATQDPRDDLEKTLNFQACLQDSISQENCSQGLRKPQQMNPDTIKNPTPVKSCCFAILYMIREDCGIIYPVRDMHHVVQIEHPDPKKN